LRSPHTVCYHCSPLSLHAALPISAFFLLGVRLEKRVAQDGSVALGSLYGNQCVASHGWEHLSHATWDDWQGSVIRTKALLSATRSEEHTSELQSPCNLVCRLLLEK